MVADRSSSPHPSSVLMPYRASSSRRRAMTKVGAATRKTKERPGIRGPGSTWVLSETHPGVSLRQSGGYTPTCMRRGTGRLRTLSLTRVTKLWMPSCQGTHWPFGLELGACSTVLCDEYWISYCLIKVSRMGEQCPVGEDRSDLQDLAVGTLSHVCLRVSSYLGPQGKSAYGVDFVSLWTVARSFVTYPLSRFSRCRCTPI